MSFLQEEEATKEQRGLILQNDTEGILHNKNQTRICSGDLIRNHGTWNWAGYRLKKALSGPGVTD